jgi:pimeloyl-ACP methyl ester carboxylesterase
LLRAGPPEHDHATDAASYPGRPIGETDVQDQWRLIERHSWEGFKTCYEARGYTVIASSWPFDNRSPADLLASPDPALARVGINEGIDHHERLIRALPGPPILIGHSYGGAITQHLLDRGARRGRVAIDPGADIRRANGRPSSRPFACSFPREAGAAS